MLKITNETKNDRTLLHISGVINAENYTEFDKALRDCGPSAELDLGELTHITSSGLKCLLTAMKRGTDITLSNVSCATDEIIRANGYVNMLRYKADPGIAAKDYTPENTAKSFKSLFAGKQRPGTANKVIALYRGREYTWEDVEKCSQLIASELAALGVKKGSHVAICGQNSINWISTFYAVQKLGGVTVLMNYFLSPEEIINQSVIGGIEFICVGRIPGVSDFDEYSRQVTAEGSRIKKTYNIRDSIDFTQRYGEYPAISGLFREPYDEDDACLMLFTSGSTGMAKGAVFSSKAILDCIYWLLDEYRINSEDRNCISLPFFHILGFAIMFVIGIKCDCAAYIPETNTPHEIQHLIETHKCTMLHSVPTMLLAILNNKNFAPEKVASLRCSILGGAVTSTAQMQLFRASFPGNLMGNIYGMSENPAISITLFNDTVEHIINTVGKPLPHIAIEIRKHGTKEALPVGEVGEICLKATTSLTCYYDLPIEQQPYDEDGWLPTGDLGMLDSDGYLIYSGRVKELIIRCGENIIPREVSDLLLTHPDISQAVALGVPHPLYGEDIVAAVVMEEGKQIDKKAMREFLMGKLAKFKFPADYFVYESFPMLGSGKVDMITLKKEIAEKMKQNE
ncbi:MAG: AMP-binding protein [Abditibacteriota bacterium]|nr:AMP-binding protein [Abditibacteriota bacterium]